MDVDPSERRRRRRRSHSRHSRSREVYIEREKLVPIRVPVPVPVRQEPQYDTFRYVDAPRRPSPPRICPPPEREDERMRIMIHDRRREREYQDGYSSSGYSR